MSVTSAKNMPHHSMRPMPVAMPSVAVRTPPKASSGLLRSQSTPTPCPPPKRHLIVQNVANNISAMIVTMKYGFSLFAFRVSPLSIERECVGRTYKR